MKSFQWNQFVLRIVLLCFARSSQKTSSFSLLPNTDYHRGSRRHSRYAACNLSKQNIQKSLEIGHAPQQENRSARAQKPRRGFLQQIATTTAFLVGLPYEKAQARGGLVQFPCLKPLGNTYYFVRVGETLLEAQDIWATNPLFLTNEDAGLSPKGVQQIEDLCQSLKAQGIQPSVVRYSFAKACCDTATIIKDNMQVTQDRLVPEFFFLDPRAVGLWDQGPFSKTQEAVWAMDVDEADYDGRGGRPLANEDGTPNETLGEHAIRLRQLFSACETFYSGDTVVLVFPDGTGPALLSCMIAGIPFNRVHELEMQSGEVRPCVTRESTLALLEARQQPSSTRDDYGATIDRGRVELKRLRALSDEEETSVPATPISSATQPEPVARPSQRISIREAKGVREKKEEKTKMLPVPVEGVSAPPEPAAAAGINTKQARAKTANQLSTEAGAISSNIAPPNDELYKSPFMGSIGALGVLSGFLAVASNNDVPEETSKALDTETENFTISTISTNRLDESMECGRRPEILNSTISVTTSFAEDSKLGEAPMDGTLNQTIALKTPQTAQLVEVESSTESSVTTVPSIGSLKSAREVAADEAMQQYLDLDDGGSAWLQSLSSILSEDKMPDAQTKEKS